VDGVVLDTQRATQSWAQKTYFNGQNRVGVVTQSDTSHQALYRSSKGRYWMEHWTTWGCVTTWASILSPRQAARWLLANEYELPEDLAKYADEVLE
jgi:hypothetical protein